MNFVSIRIVTENIKRLVDFYETITGLAARWSTDDFAEVETQACTLAISSTRAMARFQPGAAVRAAENHSVILEFRVGDVDAEYRRLGDALGEVVQAPTTMPWGNRSLLFRDPDGNLINVFTPATADAIKRYGG